MTENEKRKPVNSEAEERPAGLFLSVKRGEGITLRDDLYDFSSLLDAAKMARRRGSRLRLIDTGILDRYQLEWLAEAGADLYTSDEVRSDFLELELVSRACKKGGATCVCFHHGSLDSEADEGRGSLSLPDLQNLGRAGVYLHLTNRHRERDSLQLNALSFDCRKGGSWLVYYHHGALDFSLDELAKNRAWIHTSERIFQEVEDPALILDQLRSAISEGLRFILHVENGLDISLLRDVYAARAWILFRSSLFDHKSPLRALERKTRQKKLDFRAYYLYPNLMP